MNSESKQLKSLIFKKYGLKSQNNANKTVPNKYQS